VSAEILKEYIFPVLGDIYPEGWGTVFSWNVDIQDQSVWCRDPREGLFISSSNSTSSQTKCVWQRYEIQILCILTL